MEEESLEEIVYASSLFVVQKLTIEVGSSDLCIYSAAICMLLVVSFYYRS